MGSCGTLQCERTNGLEDCKDNAPMKVKSKQRGRYATECLQDIKHRGHSPSKRSKRKLFGTPSLVRKGPSKHSEFFKGCCLPTITENKPDRMAEVSKPKSARTSLAKLHKESLYDKKSMAFWRSDHESSKKAQKSLNQDGSSFDRDRSIVLPALKLYSHDKKTKH